MTEEHEAVIHMRDMGLLHIQRELQLAFKKLSTSFAHCFRVFSSSFDHDHKSSRPGEFHPQALTDSGLERLRSSGSYRPAAARRSNGQ